MEKKLLSFRCIIYQEKDKNFTGVCLDLDIVEEGHSSLQEAMLSIGDAINSHLHASAKLGFPKELLERPAPKEYWDKLQEIIAKPKEPQLYPQFQFYTTPPQYAAL